ncbi:unnamed protein product [Phytophthora lilii]|uniref:Unnamed protein product n=1 Tax=Phytophthora lilii TaxID=2077276 RepID=A0A9W6TST1_9STRA|nr:unnamed protein product [Phytophthora lilii]
MAITQDDVDAISRSLLLFASFLGFVTQVYSHENREMGLELNDISETSLQLTLVTQIALIGRAVCKKVKLRSILWFTYVAEALVGLGWLNEFGTLLEIINVFEGDALSLTGNLLESVSLVFVMIFRFYCLSLTSRFRTVLEERKFEVLLYVLLVIHEFPFMILEHSTGVSWEFAQGIANRVLVVACIVQNIRHKAISSWSSKNSTVRSKRYAATNRSAASAPEANQVVLKSTIFSSDIAKIAVTSVVQR